MTARTLPLAAAALVFAVSDARAGDWIFRPQDWGSQGIIITPPRKETFSTLPVVTGPSKPVPPPTPPKPPTPNYSQFQGYSSTGQALFHNPTTGQYSLTPPATGKPQLLGTTTTFGEVKKMTAPQSQPLSLTSGRPAVARPTATLPVKRP